MTDFIDMVNQHCSSIPTLKDWQYLNHAKQLGPKVPGDGPILEVDIKWGIVYARNELGWHWYQEESNKWRKV